MAVGSRPAVRGAHLRRRRVPHALGLATLYRTGLHRSFDRLVFNPREHEPHSNFGIVECPTAARTPLIVHLDDDITIRANAESVAAYLGECLTVMTADPSILGMALLAYEKTPAVWGPGQAYASDPRTTPSFDLAHPKRFFGTAASVIRRDLLERYPLERLYADGEQRLNWERLVSNDPAEFLVDCATSPFGVDPAAWKHRDLPLVGQVGAPQLRAPDQATPRAGRTPHGVAALSGTGVSDPEADGHDCQTSRRFRSTAATAAATPT